MKKIIFSFVFICLLFLTTLTGLAEVFPEENSGMGEELSFEEFEKWYDKNFDDLRKSSNEFKTDNEIKKEIINAEAEARKNTRGFNALSTNNWTHLPGDILVTDENKNVWRHGHAALVTSSAYTVEIFRPGDTLTTSRSIRTNWTNRYNSRALLRYKWYDGATAAKAVHHETNRARNNTIEYSLTKTVTNTSHNSTYCSKSVWQAYRYGAGVTLVNPNLGHVTPKMLYTSTRLDIKHSTIKNW